MSNFLQDFDLSGTVEAALPRYFSYACGKLGPARTFLTVMCMRVFGQRGYRRVVNELKDGLRTHLGWLWDDLPSPAAICKSRKKLTTEHCQVAFDAVYERCGLARAHRECAYRDLSVVALDGTRLALPDSQELRDHFGQYIASNGSSGVPMAALIQLWDVSAQQPLGFRLAPYRHSEPDEARALFDAIPPQSLLITDRGFPSYVVFADLLKREQPFLMRVQKNQGKAVVAFVESDQRDAVVDIARPRKVTAAEVPETALRLRLIKVALPDGSDEMLATNLFADDHHDADELGRLYTTRWRIETAFREMKIWHALEEFSAQHVLGIHQEVTAVLVFALLVSELEAKVRVEHADQITTQPDQPLPDIRFNRLLIADAVVGLLVASSAGTDQVRIHLDRCLAAIWRNRERRRKRPSTPRTRKRPARGNQSGKKATPKG